MENSSRSPAERIRVTQSSSQTRSSSDSLKQNRSRSFSLKGELQAELRGEGDADGGAGTEEVAESAAGYAELFVAGDGRGLCAGRAVETEGGGVRKAVDGSGERGEIANVVVAGILAVGEIEKLGEGAERHVLAKRDVAADAEADLIGRRAAALVAGGL